VPELLDALDAAGVQSVIASNGPMQKMRISLGPSGLWDHFGGATGERILSREHFKPKPDPAMILHALKVTKASPDRTVMIDDSPTGCRAAIAGGVHCIGFAARGQGKHLSAVGAEVATSMAQIRTMILAEP